jgi:hypothetical protein
MHERAARASPGALGRARCRRSPARAPPMPVGSQPLAGHPVLGPRRLQPRPDLAVAESKLQPPLPPTSPVSFRMSSPSGDVPRAVPPTPRPMIGTLRIRAWSPAAVAPGADRASPVSVRIRASRRSAFCPLSAQTLHSAPRPLPRGSSRDFSICVAARLHHQPIDVPVPAAR